MEHDAAAKIEHAEAGDATKGPRGNGGRLDGEPGASATARDARMNHEPPREPNVDPLPNRSTFLDVREVLERARRSLGRVRSSLIEPLRDAALDDRMRLFIDSLARQRLDFEAELDRAVKAAPRVVLETRVQYVVAPSSRDRFDAEPRASSADEIVERVLDCDAGVLATFRDLAERAAPSQTREFFAQLSDLIDAHHQRLSRQLQAVRDV